MNYPDHLSDDFRVLEWYGAEIRRMHGEGTKRNIKFNDEVSGLCFHWPTNGTESHQIWRGTLRGSTTLEKMNGLNAHSKPHQCGPQDRGPQAP